VGTTQWAEFKENLWKAVLFGNADFDIDNSLSLKAFVDGFNVTLSPTARFLQVSSA
jgi:hypothetical protein